MQIALNQILSKKNNRATISDLRDVNRILRKVRERDSKLKNKRISDRKELIVVELEMPPSRQRRRL